MKKQRQKRFDHLMGNTQENTHLNTNTIHYILYAAAWGQSLLESTEGKVDKEKVNMVNHYF